MVPKPITNIGICSSKTSEAPQIATLRASPDDYNDDHRASHDCDDDCDDDGRDDDGRDDDHDDGLPNPC